jgi:hypothetical protein
LEQNIDHQSSLRSSAPVTGQPFLRALGDLVSHPLRILFLWNWKSATLSIVLRVPIFIAASIRRGLKAMLAAVLVESFFCAVTAGFYGSLIQALRNAQPLWLTAVFLVVMVPGVFQVFEAYLHWSRGTPHWRVAEGVSVVVSAISSLFNWYAMRRGTFLVGQEGKRFGSDLRRFPMLLLSFFILLPKLLLGKKESTHEESEGQGNASHPSRYS